MDVRMVGCMDQQMDVDGGWMDDGWIGRGCMANV